MISSPTSQPGSTRRFLALLTLGVLLTACSPPLRPGDITRQSGAFISPVPLGGSVRVAPPRTELSSPSRSPSGQAVTRSDREVLPDTPIIATKVHRLTSGGIALTVLTVDHRRLHLSVLDNEHGPGTGATTAANAAKTSGAVAAINGGFFTPEGAPLGLVVENGINYGSLGTSSLGAGIFFHDPESRLFGLVRRKHWEAVGPGAPEFLLQSGPYLVEQGNAVSGLSKARPRPRSFLLWDGCFGWGLGHANATSLSQLASTLATQPVPGFTITSALNLDGGSSSDLWIAASVKGGPVSTRHFWNKPVRNYLLLTRTSP